MNTSTYSLICLLLLLPIYVSCCDHDQLDFTLDRVELEEEHFGRMLSVSERDNIRIAAYYYLDGASDFIATKISQQLIPAAISYYQSTLKVDRLSAPIKISEGSAKLCGNVDPPKAIYTDGIAVDLVLFVTGAENPNSSATASARPCVLVNTTERPILGVINYNFGSAWSGTSDLAYEGDIMTTLHEIAHILGFTPSLFDNYINPATGAKLAGPVLKTKIVNGVETDVLMLDPLTQRLRNYYGCPTIDGAYLENQGDPGSKGSHFERRIFFNELMTASEGQSSVSEFTLAALEGTGWYTPDYSMADPLFWGKGKGCGFLDQKCYDSVNKVARFNEFCTDRKSAGCTYAGTAKAVCGTQTSVINDKLNPEFNYFGDNSVMLDTFCDNCPYYYAISNLVCTNPSNSMKEIKEEFYGDGSMCFMGNLGRKTALSSNIAYCFKQTCVKIGTGYILQLQIGNSTVTCPSGGSLTIPGYQGTIQCPDTQTFCTTKGLTYCKRGCMGRGQCVDGTCVCREGFTGASCSMRTGIVDAEGDYDHTFLNPLAILIGIGIIAIIVIIGLIVNKIQENKERKEAEASGYVSVNGSNKRTKLPILSNTGIKTNSTYQSQAQSNSEILRQQAITKSKGGANALSAIRGLRNGPTNSKI